MNTTRRELINQTAALGALLATGLSIPPKSQARESTDPPLPPPDLDTLTLSRASFGINQQMLEDIRTTGRKQWLQQQLHWQDIDDSRTEDFLLERLETLSMSPRELAALENRNQAAGQLVLATLYRALYSQRQLREVMVEFWSNHFSIYLHDGPVNLLKTIDDREVIRPHALGNFRELLHASSKSPAMLVYLDNHTNVAGTPNENYARELMELHTLGVDGGYTEKDVQEVARCFTGWTVGRFGSPRVGRFIFTRNLHDQGEKIVLGTAIPPGGGISDGEKVIDLLASHPATAGFIAAKLVRHFVSDEPPQSLVERVAERFLETDGDIPALLREIFLSAEFAASADQKLKRPIDYVIGTLRVTGANPQAPAYRSLHETLFRLGQLPFNWVPPDGYPDTAGYWASSNGLLNRWNFAIALTKAGVRGLPFDYRPLIGRSRSPEAIVDDLARRLLHRELNSMDRELFIQHLGQEQAPSSPLSPSQMEKRVPGLMAAMLSSDYFQYR